MAVMVLLEDLGARKADARRKSRKGSAIYHLGGGSSRMFGSLEMAARMMGSWQDEEERVSSN
jgi:hypothetical protein